MGVKSLRESLVTKRVAKGIVKEYIDCVLSYEGNGVRHSRSATKFYMRREGL